MWSPDVRNKAYLEYCGTSLTIHENANPSTCESNMAVNTLEWKEMDSTRSF